MFPTATALSVDDAAKKQLESLARSGTTPQRVAQKCRVILLAQEGMSNHSIAKQLGLSRPTVIAARTAFGTGGVQVLTAKPTRSEEHTSELQSRVDLVCRLLLEKKKTNIASTVRALLVGHPLTAGGMTSHHS